MSEEAKKVAQAIAISGQKYTAPDGTKKTITYDEANFAEKIGDITDAASAAADQEKASDNYKNAHAYAKGIKVDNK